MSYRQFQIARLERNFWYECYEEKGAHGPRFRFVLTILPSCYALPDSNTHQRQQICVRLVCHEAVFLTSYEY